MPDSLLLKTCSSLTWPPGTRTLPQAARLPCRLMAIRSSSNWGVCRPGNSILFSVSSLLVMTLSTFLGNLPLTVLSVEMQQEQNGIFFFFFSAALFTSRLGYFCSQCYSPPFTQTGNYPVISFSLAFCFTKTITLYHSITKSYWCFLYLISLISPLDSPFFFAMTPSLYSLELAGNTPEPTCGKVFSTEAMSCSRYCFAFPISALWPPITVDPMVSNLKKIIFKLADFLF